MDQKVILRKNCLWWERFELKDGALLPRDFTPSAEVAVTPATITEEPGDAVNFEVVAVTE